MTTVLNVWGERAEAVIAAVAPDYDVVSLGPDDPGPPDLRADILFARNPAHPVVRRLGDLGLDWIHLPFTGIDLWPREQLVAPLITCSRGLHAIPIAEFVVGSLLATERGFPKVWITEAPERWLSADLGELSDRTVALVGLGGIGTAIVDRLRPFGVRLRALRRHPEAGAPPGVELASDLADLLSSADHLVLAAPATPATRHLLDADAFARVKPGVHITNVARGWLIDDEALRMALDDGRVASATLDTVEPEPLPAGHWMYSHPSVRLSAHVSWISPKNTERILAVFAENLRRYVAGEPLTGVVDLAAGY